MKAKERSYRRFALAQALAYFYVAGTIAAIALAGGK